jgi:hypothetical protein
LNDTGQRPSGFFIPPYFEGHPMRKIVQFIVFILILSAIMFAPLALCGCAANGTAAAPTTQAVIDEVQMDVPVAVGILIARSNDPQAEAQRIQDIAAQIARATDTQSVDLAAAVDGVIRKQINGKDRILAQILADAFFARVKLRMGLDPRSVPIPLGQLDAVRQIVKAGAQAAIDAANRYGA